MALSNLAGWTENATASAYGQVTSNPAQVGRLKEALQSADAVAIGAGAGLSTAAGFNYGGERRAKAGI